MTRTALTRRALTAAVSAALTLTALAGTAGSATAATTPQPSLTQVTSTNPTSVTASWSPASGASKYVLKATWAGAKKPVTRSLSASTRRATLTGLSVRAGTPVKVTVIAQTKRASTTSAARSTLLQPAAVQDLKVSKPTNTLTARWTTARNATGYTVQVSRTNDFTKPTTRKVSKASLALSGLKTPYTYWVRVRPHNGSVVGSFGSPQRVGPQVAQIRIGTWNLCDKCGNYDRRSKSAANIMASEKVDVFAVQEAGYRSNRDGKATNRNLGSGRHGMVRAAGGDKDRYIFYRSAKYTQTHGGLTHTGYNRYMAWAVLVDKATGADVFVANIHLTPGRGKKAQAQRAVGMKNTVRKIRALNKEGRPVILVGDFNTGTNRPDDLTDPVLRSADYTDTLRATATTAVNSKYNTAVPGGAKGKGLQRKNGGHIDRIMVWGATDTRSWKQVVKRVSDHNGLVSTVYISK